MSACACARCSVMPKAWPCALLGAGVRQRAWQSCVRRARKVTWKLTKGGGGKRVVVQWRVEAMTRESSAVPFSSPEAKMMVSSPTPASFAATNCSSSLLSPPFFFAPPSLLRFGHGVGVLPLDSGGARAPGVLFYSWLTCMAGWRTVEGVLGLRGSDQGTRASSFGSVCDRDAPVFPNSDVAVKS
jgi:hypothetical protein